VTEAQATEAGFLEKHKRFMDAVMRAKKRSCLVDAHGKNKSGIHPANLRQISLFHLQHILNYLLVMNFKKFLQT
jgi:hypothetical protein